MRRVSTILLSFVIGIAVVGYFVGISDGVPQPDGIDRSSMLETVSEPVVAADPKLVEAVSYAQIPEVSMGPTKLWQAIPQVIVQPDYDLYRKVTPSPEDKAESAKVRSSRRMFNGAPPIIPHPAENTNDAACYACHSNGTKMAGLKASVMSHQFLGNCTQCHSPMAPAPFQDIDASVETSFVGLPAPSQGERAFKGAPPTIPHSRWMRENCNACHGGPHGWAGMESTHPWRTNCTQCHAPSATLDQAVPSESIPMLPPLELAVR